jgi:hypothetical protein
MTHESERSGSVATESVSRSLHEAVVQDFRMTLQGNLLQSGDPGYDTARSVWNAMIDRHPALIARCASQSDVVASVDFAREQGLEVSVRGGGHNAAGKAVAENGLMIDLSLMKRIQIDPASRAARAEPGVLWQEFDQETQRFGLATTGGTVGTTGIAGLTLGGGQGWLASKHGLTLDNLLSVDVVTADGQVLRASATENDDLFWGLRGAGANFGVATSFEYRLHPLGQVLGGMVVYPLAQARDVLRFYREFTSSQPDELVTYAALLTTPDGIQVVAMISCYAGDISQGEQALAPLRSFGSPVADTFAPIPYTTMQEALGVGFPYGRRNYWKSGLTSQISDEAIDIMIEYAALAPSPFSVIAIADCHGAYSRVGRTDTAYCHRDLQYDVLLLANWAEPAEDESNIEWTRGLHQALSPHLSGRVYVNDLGDDDGAAGIHNAYGENYQRLSELKAKYDPTNFFHLNQNIKPATELAGV